MFVPLSILGSSSKAIPLSNLPNILKCTKTGTYYSLFIHCTRTYGSMIPRAHSAVMTSPVTSMRAKIQRPIITPLPIPPSSTEGLT